MATLTHNQKETIRKLKLKISDTTIKIAKIQDLSPIEQKLLKQALNYVVVDKVGDYEGRFMELHKYQYMIYGIIYNHLDSKQINYGTKKFVELPKAPTTETDEESLNYVPPQPEYDVNEKPF